MKLSTQILLAFAIILILSIIDTFSNYVLSLKVEQNRDFINRSQETIRISGRLNKEIIYMQSSFRGYLLTADSSFLSDYNTGLKDIPSLFNELSDLAKGNSAQLNILDSIKLLHAKWIDYTNALITAKRNATKSPASLNEYNLLFEEKFKNLFGRNINDAIAQKFTEFDRIEYNTRNVRSSKLLASIQQTHIFSLTFFALTIVIGVSTTFYIVSLISKRIKTMVRFAEKISSGEFTTIQDNRNDEMTNLSVSLNAMSRSLSKNINELESRNAELDKFAHVVSHDLKAPLRGIHNVVKWIEEDLANELSPELKKYLDIIPQRIKRMEDLINGLLDYARTREKTIPEKTDVQKMVLDIVEAIVPRHFKVEVKELPVIITERLKLEQVFTNLISNAVKFTPHKNAEIIISYKEVDDNLEFSVKDNGVGIDAEYHEKIFEIFQTLREKDEQESTGLGLALIKKILNDHDGTIHVISETGKGTEFIFTWPREIIM
jgi:signal transduction histidine kinase